MFKFIYVACSWMCVLFYFSFVCLHVCAYASTKFKVHCGSAFEPGASGLPHYCTPPVCVPDVLGALAVWRLKNKNGVECRGLHLPGSTQRAFSASQFRSLCRGTCHISKIFWNSDYCQWFPFKLTSIWRYNLSVAVWRQNIKKMCIMFPPPFLNHSTCGIRKSIP